MSDDIVPETKDWTWVLQRRCPECGLTAGTVELAEIGEGLRGAATSWTEVLARPGVGQRPSVGVWSPLEYGAHVRDVLGVFRERLALVLADNGVAFPDWDQDAAARAGDYATQEPGAVAADLGTAARALADDIDALRPSDVEHRGVRSNGSEFTVTTLLQYLWHDVVHHLHDVKYGQTW